MAENHPVAACDRPRNTKGDHASLKPIGDFVHTITFDGKDAQHIQDIAHALKAENLLATPYHRWGRWLE